MKNVIYLNRWDHIYHLTLVRTDGEVDYRLHSRICLSLEEARQVVEQWQQKHHVVPEDVQDNSSLDLNELLQDINTDFSPTEN
jgi:hypothetical protein